MARDTLTSLVGDGLARVGVSLGIKDSDYGNGFEAFCSVQLTCNQDEDSVRAAQEIAVDLVERKMADAFDCAHDLYKGLGPHPQATKRGK